NGSPGNVEKGVGHNRPNSKRNPCGSNFLRAGIHSWISIGLNDEEHLAELDELAVLRADFANGAADLGTDRGEELHDLNDAERVAKIDLAAHLHEGRRLW